MLYSLGHMVLLIEICNLVFLCFPKEIFWLEYEYIYECDKN